MLCNIAYNFALLVMDRVFESESNVIEVLSDTAQIIADVLALLDALFAKLELLDA